jgi:hypothetical protein
LREVVGLFSDEVGTFDARKLLNLRRVILAGAGLTDDEVASKARRVLSENKKACEIVIEHLKDESGRLNLDKLEALIGAFEKTRHRFHN